MLFMLLSFTDRLRARGTIAMRKARLMLVMILGLALVFGSAARAEDSYSAYSWEDLNADHGTLPYIIVLEKDITAPSGSSPLLIPAGKTVTIDLNGHTLSRGLSGDAVANGNVITVKGKLILKSSASGGKVTGGNSTGNGGGVFVDANGTFLMQSGSVEGNKARGNGGGIYVSEGSKFSVSGSPMVMGNTKDDKANNVFLSEGAVINIDDQLTSEAFIRVSSAVSPSSSSAVTLTSGLVRGSDEYGSSTNFLSDDTALNIQLANGEVVLSSASAPLAAPRYSFRFAFTCQWLGKHEDSVDWVLYHGDGTVAHKHFNKTIISDTEWLYEAWFEADGDFYVIENRPRGYKVRYENTGAHAGNTTRCYNGGKIINYRIPQTGDSANLLLWIGIAAAGAAGLATAALVFRRRRAAAR